MITKPGWYIYNNNNQRQLRIFQVFKYFPKGKCWSFNTLYSLASEENTLAEENFIFDGSEFADDSITLSEFKQMEIIFDYVFTDNYSYIIGSDYK